MLGGGEVKRAKPHSARSFWAGTGTSTGTGKDTGTGTGTTPPGTDIKAERGQSLIVQICKVVFG